jgi:hypothetical protein
MNIIEAVETYQCPGCMNGSGVSDCDKHAMDGTGCSSHYPGTMLLGAGTLALGLPKGFHRFGPSRTEPIEIFTGWDHLEEAAPNLTTIFSVPVWKHLDEHGNTIVRWFSPRTNCGWSNVILGNVLDKMPNALEITQEQIDNMD